MKTLLALLLGFSANAYEPLGAWSSTPIELRKSRPQKLERLVAESAYLITEFSSGEVSFTRGVNGISVSRGNIRPYLGLTLLWIKDDKIISAEIVVSKSLKLRGADLITVKLVLLHEMLHAIGLGHSSDSHSILYPIILKGQSVTQDDIDGIAFLYGGAE